MSIYIYKDGTRFTIANFTTSLFLPIKFLDILQSKQTHIKCGYEDPQKDSIQRFGVKKNDIDEQRIPRDSSEINLFQQALVYKTQITIQYCCLCANFLETIV